VFVQTAREFPEIFGAITHLLVFLGSFFADDFKAIKSVFGNECAKICKNDYRESFSQGLTTRQKTAQVAKFYKHEFLLGYKNGRLCADGCIKCQSGMLFLPQGSVLDEPFI